MSDEDTGADSGADEAKDEVKKPRRTIFGDHFEYFSGWQFDVMFRANRPEPSFEMFPAMGFYFCNVLDKEKTKQERDAAIAAGMEKAALRSIRVMVRVMAARNPQVYAFQPGDMFYRGEYFGQDWVQVAASTPPGPEQMVEIHFPVSGERFGYYIPAAMFLDCLRTGQRPNEVFRISSSERSSLRVSTAA